MTQAMGLAAFGGTFAWLFFGGTWAAIAALVFALLGGGLWTWILNTDSGHSARRQLNYPGIMGTNPRLERSPAP